MRKIKLGRTSNRKGVLSTFQQENLEERDLRSPVVDARTILEEIGVNTRNWIDWA